MNRLIRKKELILHLVGFHEGNAWNYTFFVPHDINGLVKLMGATRNLLINCKACLMKGIMIRPMNPI